MRASMNDKSMNMNGSNSTTADIYSPYYHSLDAASKARYNDKLEILGSIKDPYVTAATLGKQQQLVHRFVPSVC